MCLKPNSRVARTWKSESGSSQLSGHTPVSLHEKAPSVSKLRNLLLAPYIVPPVRGLGNRGAELCVSLQSTTMVETCPVDGPAQCCLTSEASHEF